MCDTQVIACDVCAEDAAEFDVQLSQCVVRKENTGEKKHDFYLS